MERNCQICGRTYKRPPALIGKFCSKKCLYIHRKSFKHSKEAKKRISDGLKKAYREGRTFAASWKGGQSIRRGYILIFSPKHPFAPKSKYIPEHRLIMEKHIGRYIITNREVVHHINGNPSDNRIENLVLLKLGEHSRYHMLKYHRSKKIRNQSLSPLTKGGGAKE